MFSYRPPHTCHPPTSNVFSEDKNRLLVLETDEQGGREMFCRQLLLQFPRETVVEAVIEKEWEGCGLAQMGHSSIRYL